MSLYSLSTTFGSVSAAIIKCATHNKKSTKNGQGSEQRIQKSTEKTKPEVTLQPESQHRRENEEREERENEEEKTRKIEKIKLQIQIYGLYRIANYTYSTKVS